MKEKWSKRQSWEWYQRLGPVCGMNYLPRTAVNSTEMWQADSFDIQIIEQELAAASCVGLNSARVFLQYLVWKADAKGMKIRFDMFLDVAARHCISVLPVLFDDCAFSGREPYLGKQDAPIPGIHNSGWTPSPGFILADDQDGWPDLAAYVQDMVGTFCRDTRIMAWDLYNEPGNSQRGNKSQALLEAAFGWAWEVNPVQPLTACIWAWNNCTTAEIAAIGLSDVVSFHSYDCAAETERQIRALATLKRPLLCTEWLHRMNGNLPETHIPLFSKWRVACYHWGLFAGKMQTYLNWSTLDGIHNQNPIWQHDLFYADGKPYYEQELAWFSSFAQLWGDGN